MNKLSAKNADLVYHAIHDEIMTVRVDRNMGKIADIDEVLYNLTEKIYKRIEALLEA
jgi:hypothetical protein